MSVKRLTPGVSLTALGLSRLYWLHIVIIWFFRVRDASYLHPSISNYTIQQLSKMQRFTVPTNQSLALYPSLYMPRSLQSRYSSVSHTPLNVDMALPPEQIYNSKDALFKAINEWAKPRGYGFVIGRSKRAPGSMREKVYFSCDRCYNPNRSVSRVQDSSSRGTGCEFSVIGSETIDKTSWELKHRPDGKYSVHNHAPSVHPAAHPVHRQMSIEVQNINQALYESGIYFPLGQEYRAY